MKKFLKFVLVATLVLTSLPISALAATVDIDLSNSGCDYYNLIEKSDYDLAPGAVESEIILNDETGNNRNVVHTIEVDLTNENISVMPTYPGISEDLDFEDSSNWKSQPLTEQAAHVENDLGLNVVGGINTNLRYDDYSPCGVLVWNGVVYSNEENYTGCYLAIDKNGKADLRSSVKTEPLTGDEWQAISVNFGWIIKDGVNQYTTDDHADASRAPRTVIGIKEDGTLVLMMNDGRQSPFSAGMTMKELAEIMLSLGCVDAVNCDGGGSSTFISEREGTGNLSMKSSPSDGSERATIGGLLVISNAKATGEFDHASISSKYDYFAPQTTYQLSAIGVDSSGGSADIPSDVSWKLSDDEFGTVTDGILALNDKTGDVEVQMIYNDKIVGKKTIHVVDPDTISFDSTTKTLSHGKSMTLDIIAKYQNVEVYCDANSYNITLSDKDAGTLDGLKFTATTDETKTGVTITAAYKYSSELSECSLEVQYGKGSEVLYDFEDGDSTNWIGVDKIDDWIKDNGLGKDSGNQYYVLSPSEYGNTSSTKSSTVSIATKENGGQVKSGDNSLAVTLNRVYDQDVGGWSYNYMYYTGDTQVWRDIDNGKNATKIGMWMYIPEEASGLYARICRTFERSDGKLGTNYDYLTSSYGKISNFTNIPESGWVYVYFDLTSSDYQTSTQYSTSESYAQNNGKGTNGDYYPAFLQFFAGSSDYDAESFTIYLDDITLDYSDVTEDRDAPVISNITYSENADHSATLDDSTTTSNKLSFSANVAEQVTNSNYSGLDYSTAKIYIDGIDMSSSSKFSSSNSKINLTEVYLVNGLHEICFEIADKQGNYTKITKTITVNGDASNPIISLTGHNDSNSTPKAGSIYYIDINTSDISRTESITTKLWLNTANQFVLDQIEVTDGFEVTHEYNELTNLVTLTIKKNKTITETGEKTLVSIPVRVWSWDEESTGISSENQGSTAYTPIVNIECKTVYGSVTYTKDVVDSSYVKGFSSQISVATEIDRNTQWHVHSTTTVEDKKATCTESGYTDRTYCEECQSVVDWGCTLPATGHTYEVVDGKLVCSCGTENSNYTGYWETNEGWMYFLDNKMFTGWIYLDDEWCYFDSNGLAATGTKEIDGRIYTFVGEKGVTLGSWVETDNGKMFYYCHRYYKQTWATIDGEKYYFDYRGIALTGICTIGSSAYEFDDDGKLIEAINGVFYDPVNKYYAYAINGNMQYDIGLIKWEDNYYYVRENGRLITWATYVSEEKANGLVPAGNYTFGEDAKMIYRDGVALDDYGKLCYYINGAQQFDTGLVQWNGDYYYVRPNGLILTWATYVSEEKANGILPAGDYSFGEDGKMIYRDGVALDDFGKLCYYVNGAQQYDTGLIQWNGDYYYVRPNGLILTWATYVTEEKANGLLPAGDYSFGEDGKMIYRDGVALDDFGKLCYYVNGAQQYDTGLVQWNGDYYYVRSNGLILTWPSYVSEEKANGLVPAGNYSFGEDGKMIYRDGVALDDYGKLCYYINGVQQYDTGLIQWNGDYYYVRSNGLILTWTSYVSEEKTNGLLPAGTYTFGEDGKMIK